MFTNSEHICLEEIPSIDPLPVFQDGLPALQPIAQGYNPSHDCLNPVIVRRPNLSTTTDYCKGLRIPSFMRLQVQQASENCRVLVPSLILHREELSGLRPTLQLFSLKTSRDLTRGSDISSSSLFIVDRTFFVSIPVETDHSRTLQDWYPPQVW